jgi:hypothetical protein
MRTVDVTIRDPRARALAPQERVAAVAASLKSVDR